MTATISIIPARGGSKGLPGKNTRHLLGEPLIAHTVRHSLRSKHVDRTIVTTDSEEIGSVARECGAEVIERPEALSGDRASSESALLHALDHLEERERCVPDLVVFLQCTSPIRADNDIDNAVDRLLETEADSLLSVCAFHRFVWRDDSTGPVSYNYDYRNRPRRQERVPEYLENGSMYVFRPWVLREGGNRLGGRIELYQMADSSAVEIDTLADFMLCETILRQSLRDVNPSEH